MAKKKKFYEKKEWTCALFGVILILLLFLFMFVVIPYISPSSSPWGDFDSDGQPNWIDLDDDNDGVPDGSDSDPLDPDEGVDDDDDDDDLPSIFLTIQVVIDGYNPGGGDTPGNPFHVWASESHTTERWESDMFEPVNGPSVDNPWSWDLYIYKDADGSALDFDDPADMGDMLFWDFDNSQWVEGDWQVIHGKSFNLARFLFDGIKNGGGTTFRYGTVTGTGVAFSITIAPGDSAHIYADSIVSSTMDGSCYAYHVIDIGW